MTGRDAAGAVGTSDAVTAASAAVSNGSTEITWHPPSRVAFVRYAPDARLDGSEAAARSWLRARGIAA